VATCGIGRPNDITAHGATIASRLPGSSRGRSMARPSNLRREGLVRPCGRGDIVIMDNLGSHKGKAGREPFVQRAPGLSTCRILTDRTRSNSSRQVQTFWSGPRAQGGTKRPLQWYGPILDTVSQPNVQNYFVNAG